MLGHHRPASETPLNGVSLAINDGPLLVLFGSSFPSSKKKYVVRVGPPLAKLSGSGHEKVRKVGQKYLLDKDKILDLLSYLLFEMN